MLPLVVVVAPVVASAVVVTISVAVAFSVTVAVAVVADEPPPQAAMRPAATTTRAPVKRRRKRVFMVSSLYPRCLRTSQRVRWLLVVRIVVVRDVRVVFFDRLDGVIIGELVWAGNVDGVR